MSKVVNLHPPEAQLRQFVEGSLSAGLSVVVSAHIECCSDCRQLSAEFQAQAAVEWDASTLQTNAIDFSAMLNSIVSHAQQTTSPPRATEPRDIAIDNRTITLPRVLAKVASEGLSWKHRAGGVSQAEVKLDDSTKCEFLYMKPGTKAPHHTHLGIEVMLVLDGKFHDEMGEYGAGDFIVCDPSHRHQPQTDEGGCLCFSVLESPLLFTEGMLRLINPINRLKFWKSQWYR